mmetsp:Transcript_8372/g.17036  ORF Transcript_8372/g.17036 Transcript_8372/m.17036 type:complete len:208 (-) Transcript_8372:380-1003(-)
MAPTKVLPFLYPNRSTYGTIQANGPSFFSPFSRETLAGVNGSWKSSKAKLPPSEDGNGDDFAPDESEVAPVGALSPPRTMVPLALAAGWAITRVGARRSSLLTGLDRDCVLTRATLSDCATSSCLLPPSLILILSPLFGGDMYATVSSPLLVALDDDDDWCCFWFSRILPKNGTPSPLPVRPRDIVCERGLLLLRVGRLSEDVLISA